RRRHTRFSRDWSSDVCSSDLYVLIIELTVFRLRVDSKIKKKRLNLFLGLYVLLPVLVGSTLLIVNLEHFTDYSSRDFNLLERLRSEERRVGKESRSRW